MSYSATMRQDGDEITMTRDELVSLVRAIQHFEGWITKPAGGRPGDVIFFPKVKVKPDAKTKVPKPLPTARTFLDHIKSFEAQFKIDVPALEKLALEILARLEELSKLQGKVTGDGSAWIVSTTFEEKKKSGDLTA